MTMINERVQNLRLLMEEKGLDAYLLISTDPHQNEYLPPYWNRRMFISGFSGDYCNIAITKNEAMLWTDGKEELKAKTQLKDTPYSYFVKEAVTADFSLEINWLAEKLPKDGTLGLDPQTITASQMDALRETLKEKNIKISFTDPNLVDLLWKDRPPFPSTPVIFRDKKYEPVSAKEKLEKIQKIMKEKNIDVHVVSNLESIARLFNVRGTDIAYTPLVVSYLIITNEKSFWFVNKRRVKDSSSLPDSLVVMHYDEFAAKLKELTAQRTVLLNPNEVSQWIINNIDVSARLIKAPSPILELMAIKTPVELAHMINANIKDSVAMTKIIYWLKSNIGKKKITEWNVSEKMLEFKKEEQGFIDLSFETTVAYGKNAAVIHYFPDSSNPKNSTALQKKGMVIIDSGGNYVDGTTDITRTVSLGPVTKEMKQNYTRVLKGHLLLRHTKFPRGTRGYQLDTLARKFLWDAGHNYYHGTGHGIGYCSCVHERTGIGISTLRPSVIDKSMTLTNEPGYYEEGHYGIRIENCVYVEEDKKLSKVNGKNPVLGFVDMTFCPYEISLIEKSMLTKQELNQINDYHKMVLKVLTPRIKDKKVLLWLKTACRAI